MLCWWNSLMNKPLLIKRDYHFNLHEQAILLFAYSRRVKNERIARFLWSKDWFALFNIFQRSTRTIRSQSIFLKIDKSDSIKVDLFKILTRAIRSRSIFFKGWKIERSKYSMERLKDRWSKIERSKIERLKDRKIEDWQIERSNSQPCLKNQRSISCYTLWKFVHIQYKYIVQTQAVCYVWLFVYANIEYTFVMFIIIHSIYIFCQIVMENICYCTSPRHSPWYQLYSAQ